MSEVKDQLQQTVEQDTSKSLQQLIERLKPLHVMLSQNTYVKHTTSRLKRIIDDAQAKITVLLLGKERVGKTTIINALLGRELLSASKTNPTSANTFIKYGEEECVKAVFLDGMVATFDIGKIELLTTSDAFCAQIIREHMDYIEIYIKHDLLKTVTIIDSVALEIGGKNTAYFSEILLERVDEILWVLNNGSPATDPEINLLTKLNQRGMKPHFIINAIDRSPSSVGEFSKQEMAKYGDKCASMLGISALQAIEAKKTNSVQQLIDSQFTQFTQLIQQLSNNNEKKTHHTIERFLDWLHRLRNEIEGLPMREPYLSAIKSIEQYTEDNNYEYSLQQRDMAIVTAYEEEYVHVSGVLKSVQTLYQLLQILTTEIYLRDDVVEIFEERAVRYQQAVLDYRKLHSEYSQEYNRLEKHYSKTYGASLKQGFTTGSNHSKNFKERAEQLNILQAKCSDLFLLIKDYEKEVLEHLYKTQNHITGLAEKRLQSIVQQVNDLNIQRKRERSNIKSYADKLSEFTCIVEAQNFIRDALKPFLLSDAIPLTDKERNQVINTIDCICAVGLSYGVSKARMTPQTDQQLYIQSDFQSNYHLQALRLTEADVISVLPNIPEEIMM
ncbi:dynamin family protein [Solibacillus sp. CAU 1738]|uniref:dynamin family protein n=1 Tax=Solibacillus sp. CAU 1738 TaxID=3140363 RepID=UPI0032604492